MPAIIGLPGNTKRSSHIAKYVLQNSVNFEEIVEDNTTEFDNSSYVQLYGLPLYTASYILRVIFLHLLPHLKGTNLENELTENALIVCLIDMVRVYLCEGENEQGPLCHPLIKELFAGKLVNNKTNFNLEHLISCSNNTCMDLCMDCSTMKIKHLATIITFQKYRERTDIEGLCNASIAS